MGWGIRRTAAWKSRTIALYCSVSLIAANQAWAVDVSSHAELVSAIAQVNAGTASTINFTNSIVLAGELNAITRAVTITGNSYTLNGANTYRGLFIAAGSGSAVSISDLTISNGLARGGNGGSGAGGGMGAGGGIFAMSGDITLTDVNFSGNAAQGGNGGGGGGSGGGGGLGGAGGDPSVGGGFGGGGGGVGLAATGGKGSAGGAGILPGGSGGSQGNAGGANSGGGGGNNSNGAGGGGTNGANGTSSNGGAGGFGGGGGGGGGGGAGGFGGGGGSGQGSPAGAGGYGGGGGGGAFNGAAGGGGFGGGNGASSSVPAFGGGGMGAGGAIFVCSSAVSASCAATLTISNSANASMGGSVTGGSGAGGGSANGSALGGAVFLTSGTKANYSIASGTTTTISGSIAGDGGDLGVAVSGGGTLALGSASNSFNGLALTGTGTRVAIGADGALGNGTLSFADGTGLKFTATGTYTKALAATSSLTLDTQGNTITYSGLIANGGSAGTLDAIGGGTLILTNASNSYTGGTNVYGATTLRLSAAGQVGTGTVTLGRTGEASLNVLSASQTFTLNNAVTIAGDFTQAISVDTGRTLTLSQILSGSQNLNVTGGGTLVLNNAANSYSGNIRLYSGAVLQGTTTTITAAQVSGEGTLVFNQTTTANFAGNIATDAVTITGAGGNVTLGGNNSITGTIAVQGGATLTSATDLGSANLVMGDASARGTLAATGTYTLSSGTATVNAGGGTINVASGQVLTLAKTVGGSGALTKNGAGTLTLTGANTYSGGTVLTAGRLIVGSDTVFVSGAIESSAIGTGTLTLDGGTLSANGYRSLRNNVQLTANGGTLDSGAHILEMLGGIADGGSAGTLTIAGASGGAVLLGGTSNYSGATIVNAGATLQPSYFGALSANSDYTVNGTLNLRELGGGASTIKSLSGSGSVTNVLAGNSILAITPGSGQTATFNGTISDNGGGNPHIGIAIGGAGTQVFTQLNDYSGGTFLTSGTLVIGDSYALGSGAVTFDGGTLRTSGAYTVANTIVVESASTFDNGGNAVTLSGNIVNGAMTGVLTLAGSGHTIVSGNNTGFSGGYSLTGGSLEFGGGNAAGTGAITLYDGAVVKLNPTNDGYYTNYANNIRLNGAATFQLASSSDDFVNLFGTISESSPSSLIIEGVSPRDSIFVLNAAHTYSGGTTLKNVSATRFNNAALGTGAITLENAELNVQSSRVANDLILNDAGPNLSAILYAGIWDGVISTGTGSSSVQFSNGTINGANTYSGTTLVKGFPVTVGNSAAFGTSDVYLTSTLQAASSSALNIANNVFLENSIFFTTAVLGKGTQLTLSGTIADGSTAGALTIGEAGAADTSIVTLSGNNSFTGGLTIAGGTVVAGSSTALGDAGGTVVMKDGTTLAFANAISIANELQLEGDVTFSVASGASATHTGELRDDNPSTPYTLTKMGAGTLTLSDSYSSANLMLVEGVLHAASTAALGGSKLMFDGGTFRVGSGLMIANDIEVLSGGGTFDTNGFDSELTGTLTSDGTSPALTISGVGSLKISGLNNLAGGAAVAGHTVLEVAGASGLSAGDVAMADDSTVRFSTTNGTFTNRFVLSGNAVFDVVSGITTRLDGVIADAAATPTMLEKIGAGTLVLSGANTYSGGSTLRDGVVLVNHASALGTGAVTLDGGTLGWQVETGNTISDIDNAITLTVNGGTIVGPDSGLTGNLNGVLSGNGLLTISAGGGGHVSLNGVNTYDGGTDIDAANVVIGNSAAFGTGDVVLRNGSNLFATGTRSVANNFALDGYSSIVTDTYGDIDLALSGVISDGGAAGQLVVTGSNADPNRLDIVRLNGANSFTGGVTVSSATLEAGHDTALGAGTVSLESHAVLQLTAGRTLANMLLSDAASAVRVDSGTATWSGDILETTSTTLNKIGAGTLVLTGANNYAGGTFVQEGTLQIGAAQSLNSLGAYDVASGATLRMNSNLNNVYIGALSGAGGLDMGASTYLHVGGAGANSDNTIFSGTVTGRSLSYNGGGTLTLTGSGSSLGGLSICNCVTSGGITLSGGSLTVSDVIAVGAGTLTIDNGAQVTAAVLTLQSSAVDIQGAGTVVNITNGGSGGIFLYNQYGPATFNVSDGAQVSSEFLLGSGISGNDAVQVTVTGANSLLSLTSMQIMDNTTLTIADGAALQVPSIDMNEGSVLTIGTGAGAGIVGDASTRIQGLSFVNSGRVVANFDDEYVLEGFLTGGLGVTVQKGYLTLNNTLNDYRDGTIIGADGVLVLENSSAGTGAIANAGFLVIQNTAASTFDYNMSGPGGLAQTGDGALTINTAQTYAGRTVIAPNATMLVTAAGDLSQSSAIELYGSLDFSGVTASNIAINKLYGDGDLSIGNKHLTIAGNGGAYSGMLSDGGAGGSLTLLGNQILNGIVSLTGTTTIGQGATLTVSGPNALGGGNLDFKAGSILKFGPSGSGTYANNMTFALGAPVFDLAGQNVTFTGVLGGPGDLAVTGAGGTLTLTNNANTYGDGTAIYGGATLRASADGQLGGVAPLLLGNASTQGTFRYAGAFALAPGRAITVNAGGGVIHTNGFDVTVGSAITGTGTLTKTGSGNLVLTGTSSFTGATSVTGGTLSVNGSLASSAVTVASGGRLGGSGTVGATTVASGGNLAPGNSIGTLTVNGNLTLASGSTYTVEVSPTAADRVNVTGTASLNGTLAIVPEAGSYGPATYRLINAASVTGTFNSVTGAVAGFTNAVQYSASGVDFVLSTPGGGVVPPGPGPSGPVITTFLFDTYGRTANQIAAGAALTASASNAPLYMAVGNVVTSNNNVPAALDAVSGEIHATLLASQLETVSFTRRTLTNRMRRDAGATGLSLWGDVSGSWGSIDGDGNAAGANRSGVNVSMGADTDLNANWRAGLAGGYSQGNIHVAARSSGATVRGGHLGGYAYGQYDAIRLRSGIVYGFGTADTLRGVNFTNFSNGTAASQDVSTLQLFGEAGYRFTTAGLSLEPFMGLAWSRVALGAFAETGGVAALGGASRTAEQGTFTLGMEAAAQGLAFAGGILTPGARAGWQHGMTNSLAMRNVSYLSTGQGFAVRGTPLDGDGAVLDLDLALALGEASTVTLGYFGSYGARGSEKGVRLSGTVKF